MKPTHSVDRHIASHTHMTSMLKAGNFAGICHRLELVDGLHNLPASLHQRDRRSVGL